MSKNDREFNISDAELLEHAEVVTEIFPSDQATFTNFDSSIKVEYQTELSASIDQAKSFETNDVAVDQQAELTLLMNNALDDCNKDYQTIAYFARKAFAKNPAYMNQFGLNDIQKARDSQPKMVIFMESLAKTAVNYQAELVAAGCNSLLIDGLGDKAKRLHDANLTQELYKKGRAINTQERVSSLNEVYRLLQPLHKAAVIIFKNDPARLKIYTMPQPTPTPETPENPV